MQRTGVNLDLRRQPGGRKRISEHGLGLGLLRVVVLGDREEVVRTHRVDEQMRTVGAVGHEPAAVKRCARTNPVRECRRGPHRHGTTHAVAGGPHLAVAGHRVLTVQEPDERPSVRHGALGAQGTHQGEDLLTRRLVPKRGAFGHDGSAHRAVVRIDDQDRIPRFGQPPSHLLEGGPQTECIGPDQDARVGAARGTHKVAVRDAVGGRYLDLRGRDLKRGRRPWQERGKSRPERQRPERAPGQVPRPAQESLGVTECLRVAHGCLRLLVVRGST